MAEKVVEVDADRRWGRLQCREMRGSEAGGQPHHWHAGRLRRHDPHRRVFKDEAIARSDVEPAGGLCEHVRSRLAARHLVTADDDRELAGEADLGEGVQDVWLWC